MHELPAPMRERRPAVPESHTTSVLSSPANAAVRTERDALQQTLLDVLDGLTLRIARSTHSARTHA
jgi:hypothetical protein